jgi:hypothetical protein
VNRRDFLKSSALGLWLPAGQGRAFAAAEGFSDARVPVAAAVCDERSADARDFAASLRRRGARIFAAGPVADGSWYAGLAALLRRRTGCVAGLTTHADFALARSCGREFGLRPAFAQAQIIRSGRSGFGPPLMLWLLAPRASQGLT